MGLRRMVVGVSVIAGAIVALIGGGGGVARAELPVGYNFLGGIPDELAHPGGSLPGSNDLSCRPSAAHPNPVVLVHGTGGSQQTNWGTYVPLLKNQGYCVFALTYGVVDRAPWPVSAVGGMTPMEGSAAQLAAYVEKVLAATGAHKVEIVGHSQGTLIPDYYAKFLGGHDKIDKYVSLAPLWQGTGVGGAAVLMPVLRQLGLSAAQFPLCQACAQFDPSSVFMMKLRAGGVYLPGITYTNVSTRNDELVVPYTSGQLPGGPNVHNIVVQQGCPVDYTEHAGLAGSRRAAYFVLNALDPAHPRPVPCDRAAPITGSAF
ncbi:esterase/lipase family protein [Gordonia sp. DT30]|uniref:esterase/lipase family protein n=1 Tax=Gordonia sp. DT30 TaxID=3416546 RepID=UPI003CEFFAE7